MASALNMLRKKREISHIYGKVICDCNQIQSKFYRAQRHQRQKKSTHVLSPVSVALHFPFLVILNKYTVSIFTSIWQLTN